jgi:hypothetical protein
MMEPSAGANGFESSYLGKDVKLCGRFALSPRGARCQGVLPCSDSELLNATLRNSADAA